MPKITFILPVYKVEKYIRRAIDSLKAQTMDDWEAILIDDGSPDNCGKIAVGILRLVLYLFRKPPHKYEDSRQLRPGGAIRHRELHG